MPELQWSGGTHQPPVPTPVAGPAQFICMATVLHRRIQGLDFSEPAGVVLFWQTTNVAGHNSGSYDLLASYTDHLFTARLRAARAMGFKSRVQKPQNPGSEACNSNSQWARRIASGGYKLRCQVHQRGQFRCTRTGAGRYSCKLCLDEAPSTQRFLSDVSFQGA